MARYIYDLFNKGEFDHAVLEGYIRIQRHPEFPLNIANYTDRAQFDRVWNDATLNCRGLIYDDGGIIVSRPFKKFFNLGENDLDITALGSPNVYEKQDGSLGITVPLPNGDLMVATRGSFASEQSVWATEWLRKNMPDFRPEPGTTQLFEIIYPLNRIVVDYEGYEGLVSLAVIDNATGLTMWDASPGWTGDVVEWHRDLTMDDLSIARPNREGYVLHFPVHDVRVKVKHEEYVRLHRVMTGATELAVWRCLAEGDGDLGAFLDGAPDDLRDWVDVKRRGMEEEVDRILAFWDTEFETIISKMPLGADLRGKDRKLFAEVAKTTPAPGVMFRLLDGKGTADLAWDQIRPHGTGDRFAGAWN